MIILGVDPGTDRAGYGLIQTAGASLKFLAAGILKTGRRRGADALLQIKKELDELIREYRPAALATEKLFFMKNQTTAMSIAEARGVILLVARERNLKICEVAPTEVKLGIAGFGRADKTAVQKMVRLLLKMPELKMVDDAFDALAIAIVAARILSLPASGR